MNSTTLLSSSARRLGAPVILGSLALVAGCFTDSYGGAGSITSTGTSEGTGTGAGETTSSGAGTSTGEVTSSGTTAPTTTGVGSSSTGDASTGEPGCEAGARVSRDEALTLVRAHADSLEPEARGFARYISLIHLHNAGLCGEDIDRVHRGVSKLVNALSRGELVRPPTVIDKTGLVLHIDLRDYAWGEAIMLEDVAYANAWERIVRGHPYAIEFTGDLASDIAAMTKTNHALLPADALMAVAAVPPVYYDVLRVPLTLDALAQELELDLAAMIQDERDSDFDRVARAAFHDSGVSVNHRVVERYDVPLAGNRALWRAYDFASNAGTSNVFVLPFEFTFDGAELIFTLPNGLDGYMITDAAGQRLDAQQIQILQDPDSSDHIVRAGLSCFGCHAEGVHPVADDLRWEIDQGLGESDFTADELQQIRALYPKREDFEVMVVFDQQRFAAASAAAGAPVGGEEPVRASVTAFEQPVDLSRAAAELWVTEEELMAKLGALPLDLAPLAQGTIPRHVFTANFAEAVCELKVGTTAACP